MVIVEHDSVGYLDPDVRAVLDDFAENARSAASALISGRWPAADLNGRLVRPLRDLRLPSAREYHALHFLGYHANPKEMNMTIIKSYAAKEAGADLSLWEYDAGELQPEDVEVEVEYCGICHSDLSMIDNEWGCRATRWWPVTR